MSGNNFIFSESIGNRDIDNSPIFVNSISPKFTNKTFFKENGEKYKDFIKFNRNKKSFIERPGDWICYNCKNLNFAFRTNCNRCHLTKSENQKYFQTHGQI
jgi:hypothetical protein